jgi:hypothetical protein
MNHLGTGSFLSLGMVFQQGDIKLSYGIRSLAYDSRHNVLYAGSDGIGVWKYNVKTSTWTDTGGGVSRLDIPSLVYDSGHNVLYAAGDPRGVWKYDGNAWADITTGLVSSDISPTSLAYDSTHNLLYAGLYTGSGTVGGVLKYDGKSWTNSGEGISKYDIPSLAYDSDHNVLYAGCYYVLPTTSTGIANIGKGVWKYDGGTWTSTDGGVSGYTISSLVYDSGNNILYASCVDPNTSAGKRVWKYASAK